MNEYDYNLRLAHQHADELRAARRTSRRTNGKGQRLSWRRTTPRLTTE
ncbi:MAG TPA: hypothetical protein VFK52_05900 [Nocardioidaceae bacterium]|nr:hypothetical protein [Nocardioidaceae bacterium]